MGYRIEYGPEKPYRNAKSGNGRIFWLTGALLLLFVLLTAKLWPPGQQVLEEILLPGDPAVTKRAFSVMSEQLRQGEAVGDAVVAFCQEVIDGAEIPN